MGNINKSETKRKKDVDEWVDGEGKFHRKVVIETITSPINTRQATNPNKINQRHRFFRSSKGFPEFRFQGFQGNQEFQFPEPKQFFGNNMSDKPAINVKEFIEKGKKILSGLGIDVEKEIKNLFTKPETTKPEKEKSAEELVKETKESEIKEEPKQEVKEETKAKPLKKEKEVKTWQKNQKLKKQNQKIQKIQKKK